MRAGQLAECPGHWEWRGADKMEWVEGRMPPEEAILEDFLALVQYGGKPVQAQRV